MTDKEKTEVLENDPQIVDQTAQAAEAAPTEDRPKEKTAEELALEQGYYACCFRSH